MKRLILWGMVLVLAACSSGDAPQKPAESPTPAPIVWQRPQAEISQDTFADIQVTGLLRLHDQTVNDVAFSPGGTLLASLAPDRKTAVWDLETGETIFVWQNDDNRHIFFSPDDNTVVTVDRDGAAHIWGRTDTGTFEKITQFDGRPVPAEIVIQSPDRALLAFGGHDGGVSVWQLPDAQLIAEIPTGGGVIQSLTFSPDNAVLASINEVIGVRLWAIPSGELLHHLDIETPPRRVVFSPDSRRLAISNADTVQLWDIDTESVLYTIPTTSYATTNSLVFSPDGSLLAGCGPQTVVGVWDAATGDLLGGLTLPDKSCRHIAFSPDSTLLVTLPSPGQDVYLWDIQHITDNVAPADKPLRRRDRHNMGLYPQTRFYNLAWSEDGRFIALLDELGPVYMLSAAAQGAASQ